MTRPVATFVEPGTAVGVRLYRDGSSRYRLESVGPVRLDAGRTTIIGCGENAARRRARRAAEWVAREYRRRNRNRHDGTRSYVDGRGGGNRRKRGPAFYFPHGDVLAIERGAR